MKQQIPPTVVAVIIGIVLVSAVLIGWKLTAKPDYSKARPPAGPIKLPPSQVGTKLGNQVLGTEIGGNSAQQAPK